VGSVLVMSLDGDGIPLALRLAQEKNIVKVWIKDSQAHDSLRGYKNPSLVGQPKMLDQYDLILFDMVGLGAKADALKGEGRTVLGGGSFNDKLELDRSYGEKVCKSLTDLKIPDGQQCTSQQALLKVLNGVDQAKVVKPKGNKSTTLTLVSKDPQNRTLKSLVKAGNVDLYPCVVQDYVEGVEVSTEGWFNGQEFVAFNHTLEQKRLMEGNLGPQTGCMGNTVWACGEDELVKCALLPLEPLLRKVDYLGPLDVNCICQEGKAWFLEYTSRFGYDAIQAYSELIKGKLFDFLWRLSIQESLMEVSNDYAISVRLSMPPYPQEGAEGLKGVEVISLEDEAKRHVWLADVMKDSEGKEVLAGVDGVVGCVSSRGQTINEARRRVYRTIQKSALTQDLQYRKDIGAGVEESIEKLKVWGWLDA